MEKILGVTVWKIKQKKKKKTPEINTKLHPLTSLFEMQWERERERRTCLKWNGVGVRVWITGHVQFSTESERVKSVKVGLGNNNRV